MAEVEHVASRGPSLVYYPADLAFDHGPARTEHGRIQVPLQRLSGYPSSRLVERHSPVDPDDLRSGSTHQREQLTRTDAEMDPWCAQVRDG